MKLMTEMVRVNGEMLATAVGSKNHTQTVATLRRDAAAAHALWLAIVGSVDSNSSLARADALLIAADKIMAEWGFDREKVE